MTIYRILEKAIQNGDLEEAQKLIENIDTIQPLELRLAFALERDKFDAALRAIQSGANANGYPDDEWRERRITSLSHFCFTMEAEKVAFLLQHGADPLLPDEDGKSTYDYWYEPDMKWKRKYASDVTRLLDQYKVKTNQQELDEIVTGESLENLNIL